MAIMGAPGRFPTVSRILTYDNAAKSDGNMEYSDELAVSTSDSVFGFLEGSSESSTTMSNDDGDIMFDEGDDEDGENSGSFEENKNFWENQQSLLQATLCRTTSLETGIRNVTKEALKELQEQGNYCKCGKVVSGSNCRNCLMREVSNRLRNAGYNSAICRTKWKSSPEIPSGEHKFIDVIDNSNAKKGEVRVIVELSFRADFEMARASNEYNQLISRLPEVFVGKAERLKTLIKVLCAAAKKCMKDKKMHMGPWRKQKYMQSKWFYTNCERVEEANAPINRGYVNKISKPARAASLLTVALMDMPSKAVAVV